jgi:hypothetical protein
MTGYLMAGALLWALSGWAAWAGQLRVDARKAGGWWLTGLGGVLFVAGLVLFKSAVTSP